MKNHKNWPNLDFAELQDTLETLHQVKCSITLEVNLLESVARCIFFGAHLI